MLLVLALAAALAVVASWPGVGTTFSGTTANPNNNLTLGSLTGANAPAGGSTVTAAETLAGGCTTSWTALSGGTAVASTYRLTDLVSGSTLTEPGNVNAGSYSMTPTQTVSRQQLTTRTGSLWTSTAADSTSVACVLSSVKSVANGGNSACAIRTDSTLWCWGLNDSYQLGLGDQVNRNTPVQVSSAAWANVALGENHGCGVRTNGTLWCWGVNTWGQLGVGDNTDRSTPAQVGSATSWRQVSSGNDYSCAVQTTGSLWCWGADWGYQLGQGNTNYTNAPVQVGSATTWRQVSAGAYAACAVRTDATLWCWGTGWTGALGQGDLTDRTTPTQVGTATDWRNVTVGFFHACATRASGALWCWGYNWNAELGDGTHTDDFSPAAITSPTPMADLALGENHSCGTGADGGLYCWGWDGFDQLGNGTGTNDVTTPTQVGSATTWGPIATTRTATCAIRTDSTLWCWGSGAAGETGTGQTANASPAAVDANTWTAASMGASHACGIRSGGTLWCWGSDTSGQTGQGVFWTYVPLWYGMQVGSGTDWASVSAGGWHSCAVKTTGTLWCWGNDAEGELGDGGTNANQSSPTQVGTATNWSSVSAGTNHTCAVKTTGTLWCWGDNSSGQLGLGNTTAQTTPQQVGFSTSWTAVSAGFRHTCGLQGNNLYCWGENSSGEVGNGNTFSPQSSPVFIAFFVSRAAAGASFTCAVKTTGTLWCWGYNGYNEVGDNTTTNRSSPTQISTGITDWTDVTSGFGSSCARRATSSAVYCWGMNRMGQGGQGTMTGSLATPTGVSGLSAASLPSTSFGQHHLALSSGGTLSSWGGGENAELGRWIGWNVPTQASGTTWRP